MYGNPDELDRIAGEIEKRAESVRARGTEMIDRARAMQWKSVAADRCRDTVESDKRKLFQAAEGLDGAAAALRRHAQEVREMIAAIKRIAETVTGWFKSAIDTFNRAVDAFNDAVKDIANGVADALGFGGGQLEEIARRDYWRGTWQHVSVHVAVFSEAKPQVTGPTGPDNSISRKRIELDDPTALEKKYGPRPAKK